MLPQLTLPLNCGNRDVMRHFRQQFEVLIINTKLMVDTERRKKLALHLRHLSIGLITNDEFEGMIMEDVTNGWLPEQYHRAKEAKLDDPIIRPMLELCWCLYSDLKEHKLSGRDKLTDEQLKYIARFILFLHSDCEYEWTYIDPTNPLLRLSFKELLLSALTLGQYYRDKKKEREQEFIIMQHLGDYDYWPFLRREQLKKQPFLSGQRKANA